MPKMSDPVTLECAMSIVRSAHHDATYLNPFVGPRNQNSIFENLEISQSLTEMKQIARDMILCMCPTLHADAANVSTHVWFVADHLAVPAPRRESTFMVFMASKSTLVANAIQMTNGAVATLVLHEVQQAVLRGDDACIARVTNMRNQLAQHARRIIFKVTKVRNHSPWRDSLLQPLVEAITAIEEHAWEIMGETYKLRNEAELLKETQRTLCAVRVLEPIMQGIDECASLLGDLRKHSDENDRDLVCIAMGRRRFDSLATRAATLKLLVCACNFAAVKDAVVRHIESGGRC